MRYLVGFVFVFALVGLPPSTSAQAEEEPAPSSEPAPEEPAPEEGVSPVEAEPPEIDTQQQQELKKEQRAPDDSLSVELRFRIFTNAFRWSSFRSVPIYIPSTAPRSQYGVPGIGVRFYPKGGHGVLLDADYRFDLDTDYILGAYLRTNFTLAHAGYAYRHVIPAPRKPDRRAWALTAHGSMSAGASRSSYSNAGFYESQRSPVIGARFGFDADWHFNRFFMGWLLRYEILSHTKGWLRKSQFVSFNLVPVFAIGASLGREVVRAPP